MCHCELAPTPTYLCLRDYHRMACRLSPLQGPAEDDVCRQAGCAVRLGYHAPSPCSRRCPQCRWSSPSLPAGEWHRTATRGSLSQCVGAGRQRCNRKQADPHGRGVVRDQVTADEPGGAFPGPSCSVNFRSTAWRRRQLNPAHLSRGPTRWVVRVLSVGSGPGAIATSSSWAERCGSRIYRRCWSTRRPVSRA